MAHKHIKQHGLRRTGTNLLRLLLQWNFDCRCHANTGAWKHGADLMVRNDPHPRPIVVTVRHPLSWVPSYWRYMTTWQIDSVSRYESLADFVERVGEWGRCPAMTRWNFAGGYWAWKGVKIVRFEDLLADTEGVLNNLAEHFGLERKTDELVVPRTFCAPGPSTGGFDEVKRHDGARGYMANWTHPLTERLRSLTDPAVLKALGYPDTDESWTKGLVDE